jgi:hypothetical protein
MERFCNFSTFRQTLHPTGHCMQVGECSVERSSRTGGASTLRMGFINELQGISPASTAWCKNFYIMLGRTIVKLRQKKISKVYFYFLDMLAARVRLQTKPSGLGIGCPF